MQGVLALPLELLREAAAQSSCARTRLTVQRRQAEAAEGQLWSAAVAVSSSSAACRGTESAVELGSVQGSALTLCRDQAAQEAEPWALRQPLRLAGMAELEHRGGLPSSAGLPAWEDSALLLLTQEGHFTVRFQADMC